MIKYLYYTILISTALMLICSCKTTKQVSKNHSKAVDSFQKTDIHLSDNNFHLNSSYTLKDTIIVIQERVVLDTLYPDDLKPVYNAAGVKVPNTKTIKGKGVSVTTTALPSGQIVIQGNCDSLEKLIPGLINQRDFFRSQLIQNVISNQGYNSSDSISGTETSKSNSVHWLTWLGIALLAAFLIIRILFKLKIL